MTMLLLSWVKIFAPSALSFKSRPAVKRLPSHTNQSASTGTQGTIIPNVLDRFKVRIKVRPTPLFCIPLEFDENNVRAFTIGYKDGPVRVIRRNIFWVVLAGVRIPFAPASLGRYPAIQN